MDRMRTRRGHLQHEANRPMDLERHEEDPLHEPHMEGPEKPQQLVTVEMHEGAVAGTEDGAHRPSSVHSRTSPVDHTAITLEPAVSRPASAVSLSRSHYSIREEEVQEAPQRSTWTANAAASTEPQGVRPETTPYSKVYPDVAAWAEDMRSPDPDSHDQAVRTLAEKVMKSPKTVDEFMVGRAKALYGGARPKNPQFITPVVHAGARPREPASAPQVAMRQPLAESPAERLGATMAEFRGVLGEAMRDMAGMVHTIRQEMAQGRGPNPVREPNIPLASSRRAQPQPETSDEDGASHASTARRRNPHWSNPKLPPFCGKEKWEIWFTRFVEVARLNCWSDRHRLQELLPRLQGPAGDFAYGQLPAEVRADYGKLVQELSSRFRVVETRKAYGAQFSNRSQKPGESVEEYAAELKRLYVKAHPHRNEGTRNEDLLRRFLDGLYDERARFHVEFVKEPDSVDQAVFEVINFQETRRRPFKEGKASRPTRMVKDRPESSTEGTICSEESDSDGDQTDRVGRVPSKVNRHRKIQHGFGKPSAPEKAEKSSTAPKDKVLEMMEKLEKRLASLEQAAQKEPHKGRNTSTEQPRRTKGKPNGRCFKCGEEGHWAKDCPVYKWVQVPKDEAQQPPSTATPSDTQMGASN